MELFMLPGVDYYVNQQSKRAITLAPCFLAPTVSTRGIKYPCFILTMYLMHCLTNQRQVKVSLLKTLSKCSCWKFWAKKTRYLFARPSQSGNGSNVIPTPAATVGLKNQNEDAEIWFRRPNYDSDWRNKYLLPFCVDLFVVFVIGCQINHILLKKFCFLSIGVKI